MSNDPQRNADASPFTSNTAQHRTSAIPTIRSRSNSDLNSQQPQQQSNSLPTTTLRARLSGSQSTNPMPDNNKTKMKLKLQLSPSQINQSANLMNMQTTPVLLSPRGTPNTSPDAKTDSFFPSFETINFPNSSNAEHQSYLDTLLNEDDLEDIPNNDDNTNKINNTDNIQTSNNISSSKEKVPQITTSFEKLSVSPKSPTQSNMTIRPALKNSPSSSKNKSKSTLLQTKLQRLTTTINAPTTATTAATSSDPTTTSTTSTPISASNTPRSPLNNKLKSRNLAYQAVPEPVRPQTSILKSNFNTKFSQQYQQQEKMYLTGINKYRNKYKNVDEYYNKAISVDTDIDSNNLQSNESIFDLNKSNTMDSEISYSDDDDDLDYLVERTDKEREFEALKALNQQIGSDLLNKEIEVHSEYSLDSNVLLDLLNRNDEIKFNNTKENGLISERLEWQVMLQTILTGDVVTGEKTKLIKPLTDLESENVLRVGYKEDFWLGIRAKLYGRTEEEQKRLVMYHRGLVDEVLDEIMNFKLKYPDDGNDTLSYIEKVRFASIQVNSLLDKYERCQELWRTQKEMETDKPLCSTIEFNDRISCLIAWTSVTEAVERELNVLRNWVGNYDLDILRPVSMNEFPNPTVCPNLLNDSRSNSSTTIQNVETLSPSATTAGTTNTAANTKDNHIFKDDRPFVERILKEKDIENLFNKRLFTTFSHWTIKAKNSFLEYNQYFNELGLPSYLDNLFVLTNFPSKLMKEIIKTRLAYADKLKNPTMMMIDQILDDLKTYLKSAIEIRISMLEYCAPVEGWVSFPDYQDTEFDNTVKDCVKYYLSLLNRKLLFSPKGHKSFRTFKEPEELEKEWEFLQNIGFYINDFSVEFSTQICSLFLKLTNRLYTFIQNQIQGPPSEGYRLDSQRLIRWYSSSIENIGQLRRKFHRFELHLFQYFQNAINFKILPQKTQKFFNLLKESNHALYHNSRIAEDGIYIFVSESLINRPNDVESILRGTYLGVDFNKIPKRHMNVIKCYNPTIDYFNNLPVNHNGSADSTNKPNNNVDNIDNNNDNDNGEDDDDDLLDNFYLDYVIIVVPPKALMWDGIVVPFNNLSSITIEELKRGNGMFITKGGPDVRVNEIYEIFESYAMDTTRSNNHLCCSVPKIEDYFHAGLKLFSRISCLTIDCTPAIRNQCRGVGNCQELVNNIFLFARDIGKDSIRNNTVLSFKLRSSKSIIILRLIKLAIEWLSFIVDDCSPTDPKTFRWCVSALEFAMDVTRGFNILTLDSQKFYRLKDKVAGCMSLLIAHFDIMGARAKELQKTRMQSYDLKTQKDIYTLDDESLGSLRQHIMLQIKQIEEERRNLQVEQSSVGRVLDDTDMENQLLTYLASSFSSVSIRWQKGKFLGGGTFGSVYASINLDTGGPMAVKEIRFQDRQSIKTVVPAIKGEMSVLELLSHPNIVQFFGVEVHRDRVYIFMEYCSGGSLSGLLEYGRIEDEIVIQLYTLQMLEALAYLHQFGIVHRDVKPDNILLDHLGVIKFVDFGSAKVIAIPNGGSSSGSGGSSGGANGGNNNSTNTSRHGSNSSTTVNNETGETNNNNNANNSGSNNNVKGLHQLSSPSTASLDKLTGSDFRSPTSVLSSTNSYFELHRQQTSNANTLNKMYSSLTTSTSSTVPFTPNATSTGGSVQNPDTIVESLMDSKKSPHALTGTPMYMSPETIKGENMGKFGAMDIWSLGCCVLEMATGRRPWSNLDNEFAVMYHIAAGHLPQFPNSHELSEQGLTFLSKCLTIDPMKRASAVELLQDPWIQAIRNEAFSDPNSVNLNESLLVE